jgi:hypothetical protein
VAFITWIKTGWLGAFSGGFWIGMTLVAIVICVLINGTKNYLKHKQFEIYFLITLIGLGFLLPVMLFTERLWPHYLWKGHVFLLLGTGIFVQPKLNFKKFNYILMILITVGGCLSIISQGKYLFSLEKQSKTLIENSHLAYSYIKTQKNSFVSVQDISVYYPFNYALKENPYHPFAEKKSYNLENQQYRWSGFISPQILRNFNADFLIVNKRDFENQELNSNSKKDELILINDAQMRNKLGKSIFLDTIFGTIKVYRIKDVN